MSIYRDFNIEIEETELLRLLGYNDGLPDDEIMAQVRDEIEMSRQYINPELLYEKVNIEKVDDNRVVLENSVTLEGSYIVKKLKECKYVIITAATLGKEIDEVIKKAFDSGDYLKGMIADSIGSIAIEYVNKVFWNKLINEINGTNIGITSRLSPGTGGWDISAQKSVFECLNADSINLALSDTNLMTPLKSTTTVYGFGEGIGITRAEHICSECNMKNCAYRMDKKTEVIVYTAGSIKKAYYVDRGSNLLEFLRKEKVSIQSTCGGKGTCGKCKVKFIKGAGVPSDIDRAHLSQEELENGIRLACSFKVIRPVEIEVPDFHESMDIMTGGYDIDITPDSPAVKKYMELNTPAIDDQRGDFCRIKDEIGTDSLKAGIGLMRKIPYILRDADFKVTAAAYGDTLIGIEKGDTSEKLYGAAVDIGTTTVACYLLDLHTGSVIDVESDVNRQRSYGADVISRINYTLENENGLDTLRECIINQLNNMVKTLCTRNSICKDNIYNMTIVGNTTMIHMFLSLPCKNIALSPYIPVTVEALDIKAEETGIDINGFVSIVPSLASYVGSDITAGILSCGMWESEKYSLLLDLGTNGEMALGNKDGILTCSTAAGPAFEGANIKCGIGGIKGAISKIDLSCDKIYDTIGNSKPCGICGSGVLDMVSELLKFGIVDETGRLLDNDEVDCPLHIRERISSENGMRQFVLDSDSGVVFTQKDVREVQLAKAAVYAGIQLLLKERGINASDVEDIYIAGGFGNFMKIESALNIGLLLKEFEGRVKSIGNSAGTGARMYLLSRDCRNKMKEIIGITRYIELSTRQDFQDYFIDSMIFGG